MVVPSGTAIPGVPCLVLGSGSQAPKALRTLGPEAQDLKGCMACDIIMSTTPPPHRKVLSGGIGTKTYGFGEGHTAHSSVKHPQAQDV